MAAVPVILGLALVLPAAGLVAAVATGNAAWLWLCLPLVIFLS